MERGHHLRVFANQNLLLSFRNKNNIKKTQGKKKQNNSYQFVLARNVKGLRVVNQRPVVRFVDATFSTTSLLLTFKTLFSAMTTISFHANDFHLHVKPFFPQFLSFLSFFSFSFHSLHQRMND